MCACWSRWNQQSRGEPGVVNRWVLLCAALPRSSSVRRLGRPSCGQNRRDSGHLGKGTPIELTDGNQGNPSWHETAGSGVGLWTVSTLQDLPLRHPDANDARLTGVRRRRAESRYQARVPDRARDVTHASTHAVSGHMYYQVSSPPSPQNQRRPQCDTLRDNCRFSRRPSPPSQPRPAERPIAVGPLFFPRRDTTERVPPGANLGSCSPLWGVSPTQPSPNEICCVRTQQGRPVDAPVARRGRTWT